jgi:aspartyl-tRNA(Asn)/glutamyl-tRNA(Gln) amidotransferase subunit B
MELYELPITAQDIADIQGLVDSNVINDKIARKVIEVVIAGEGTPAGIVEEKGWTVVTDTGELSRVVESVIADNEEIATKIREGKVQAAGALIGQVMKAMGGQADAAMVRELIITTLTDP